jgi:hypothetical protein
MRGFNGGILGKTNNSSSEIASGIWSGTAVELAKRNNSWPNILSNTALRLDFDQTTTLPAGISFTRATNGTFFNSAGTLTTAGSGVARFDHRLEGGVWKNKGLLIEEARTNLVQRSEEFNDVYWAKFRATISANQALAPNGTTTADKLFENTENNSHGLNSANYVGNNFNIGFSVFVKAAERSKIYLQVSNFVDSALNSGFDVGNGTILYGATNGNFGPYYSNGVATITDVGNGWYRCSVHGTKGGGSTANYMLIGMLNDSNQSTYAGSTSNGILIWGAQMELGSFPTSYIQTVASTATRNADVASMTSTNFSSWYNATEGSIFWQGDLIAIGKAVSGVSSARAWVISDGGINERMIQSAESQPNGVGTPTTTGSFIVIDNNVTVVNIFSPSTPNNAVANIAYKYANAYKVDDFALSLNGESPTTDTSATVPTVDRLELGHEQGINTLVLCGHIAKFYYWNTRKPNEFLQLITG